MTTAASLLHPGETLGGFRVEDVIGIGGMAIVYRAEQVSLGRPVALKVLSSKLTNDDLFRERFRREGKHAALLEHPNIVPVYDSGEEDGHLYLAMRLVEGTNLAELVGKRGVSADHTIDILRPIASALDTAHAAGLIHRDVKPQNVLITDKGHPYLADFGVAKGSNTAGLTATGGFVGSVNYASPEQIKGLTLTPASDIYALTAVLYQCLTGEVPYPRETDAGVMHAHLSEPPPTLPAIEGADSEFHSVLARGMAKDPGARYGHAGDLMNAAALCVRRMASAKRKSVPAFPTPRAGEDPSGAPDQGARSSSARSADMAQETGEDEVLRGKPEVKVEAGLTAVDRRREPPPPVETPRPGFRSRLRGTLASLVAVVHRGLSASRASIARRRLHVGLVAALLVVVAVVAIVLGNSGGAHALTVSNGHLALTLEPRWHSERAALAGLTLTAPIGATDGRTRVYAGTITAPGAVAASVPPTVLAHFGKPSQVALVRLPLGLAKRYAWSTSSSSASLVLIAISTGHGDIAVACQSLVGSATSVQAACGTLAEKARVIGTTVEYPGVDPQLVQRVSRALHRRSRISSALRGVRASRLEGRAGAGAYVANVDRLTARELEHVASPLRDRSAIMALAGALATEATLTDRMAAAARRADRASYENVRVRLGKGSLALVAAAARLAALGFGSIRITPVRVPQAPPRKRTHSLNSSHSASHQNARSGATALPSPASSSPPSPSTPSYQPPAQSAPKSTPKSTPQPSPPSKNSPEVVVSAPK